MSDHRFRVGDATGATAALLAGERVSVFYTDPPWGPGKMKYFEKLAATEAGTSVPARDYRVFLQDVLREAARSTDGPVFVEYGKKWKDDVTEVGQGVGLKPIRVIEVPYSGGSYHLHIFQSPTSPIDVGARVTPEFVARFRTSKGGAQNVVIAIEPFAVPGGIVLDPCCGYGCVFAAAKKVKMRFYGNELNGRRMARTQAQAGA